MPTILVVDDDRAVQEMLVDLLQDAGYDIETCRDGRKVLPLLEQQPVDLVILDVLIPHLNGFTLIEHLRAHPTLAETRVLMISGIYRSRNHRTEMTTRFGVIDYLDKPLSTERLLSLIDNAIGPGSSSPRPKKVEPPPELFSREHSQKIVLRAPEPEPENENLVGAEAKAERAQVEKESRQSFKTSAFLLQGSIEKNQIPAVLGKLWHGRKRGALLIRRRNVKKIIYVNEGSAYAVKSNLITECLGQLLLRERVITESECAKSLEEMKTSGKRQGEALVEMRALTEKNLEYSLGLQLESKLFEAFTWDQGEYRFNSSATLPPAGIKLEWRGAAVITEGIRRTFDETRLRSLMVPILDIPLEFRQSVLDFNTLGLEDSEKAAVICLDLPATTRELLDSSKLDPPDTLRLLYTLIALELLGPRS